MNRESRKCQNCRQDFWVEPEDFAFYEKIKVPPPTWCPECRMLRRAVFRNQRTLYRREVKGYEGKVLSVYPESSGFQVYYRKNWTESEREAVEFGKDYDFSRPFFVQIAELMKEVPWQHIYNQNEVNSEYCSNALDLKNCYLMFNSAYSENSMYGSDVSRANDSLDITDVEGAQSVYELVHARKCNNCFFSSDCAECANVRFSHNLVNCHHCVGCVGLRHKSYCIFNKQYSKEDYFRKIKEFDFGSYGWVGEVKKRLAELKLRRPARYMHGRQNVNSSGDYLNNSKNANFCFISKNIEDSKYCQYILFVPGKDCYDSTVSGGEKSYENSIAGGYDVRFCWLVGGLRERSVDAQYSINCFNCSHIFGCVGLLNKNYCILNKQYTKEEYEKLVPKIIDHMMNMPYLDELGRVYRYGEFFPPQFSPYAYNETLAQEVKPLNKQAVFSLGFGWKDREADPPNITLKAEFLPDNIRDVSDSVIDEIIGCAHEGKCDEQCTVGFKILREELSFYRRMNLPLPRLCPNCRHFECLKQRNPLKLWHRKCQCAGNKKEEGGQRMGESRYHNTAQHFHGQNPCPNEFETSYAPDRPEIVYCEQCYNSEVV